MVTKSGFLPGELFGHKSVSNSIFTISAIAFFFSTTMGNLSWQNLYCKQNQEFETLLCQVIILKNCEKQPNMIGFADFIFDIF